MYICILKALKAHPPVTISVMPGCASTRLEFVMNDIGVPRIDRSGTAFYAVVEVEDIHFKAVRHACWQSFSNGEGIATRIRGCREHPFTGGQKGLRPCGNIWCVRCKNLSHDLSCDIEEGAPCGRCAGVFAIALTSIVKMIRHLRRALRQSMRLRYCVGTSL